jgi:phosphatidylserine/phosphatidylglycerophosphate/cardiolipin synthase-like enzyme
VPVELRTLTDGGQAAAEVAGEIATFLNGARESLALALYDVRLESDAGALVLAALLAAHQRGVRVRLLFDVDHPGPIPVPPPPETRPEAIEQLPVETRGIAGIPDLMHHKFCVRDDRDVWTGSMNWTLDSWTRQENLIANVSDVGVARAFQQNFEELWRTVDVDGSGNFDAPKAEIRPWFCPGRGEDLSMHIAGCIHRATRRVRIASPVITTAPILAALARATSECSSDIAGVVDGTQMEEVYGQWVANGNAAWKLPLIQRAFEAAPFSGKPSTPYSPDSIHDYMHAKVTVCDDVVFAGSFNLSHSGEQNAENVLEIHDAAVADRMAAFVDAIRERYPTAPLPRLQGKP